MDDDIDGQPLLEGGSTQDDKTCSDVFLSNIHAFFFHSAQFAIDVFWTIIMFLAVPFIEVQLRASPEVATMLWISGPVGGLIIGNIVSGVLMDLAGNLPSSKRRLSTIVMCVSFVAVFGLSLGFAGLAFLDVSTDDQARVAQGIAIVIFFLLMCAINFYMPSYWSVKALFGDATISRFAPPIWSAAASFVVMAIIKHFPIPSGDPRRMIGLFAVAGGLMAAFTVICLVSLICSNLEKADKEERENDTLKQKEKYEDGANDPQNKSRSFCDILCESCRDPKRNCCDVLCKPFDAMGDLIREGGWFTSLITFCTWAALYSFQPFATTWYAKYIYHAGDNGLDYDKAVIQATGLLVWAYLAQAVASIIFFVLSLCLENTCLKEPKKCYNGLSKDYHYYHNPYPVGNLYLQIVNQLVGLVAFTTGLLLIGYAENNVALFPLLGCVLFGMGPAVIYPLREFQRAFLRALRYRKDSPTYQGQSIDEKRQFYRKYFARDSNYDIVFNNFLVLGQLLTILLFFFLSESAGYPTLIKNIGGWAGGLSILLVLLTCLPSCRSRFDEEEGSCICKCFCRKMSAKSATSAPSTGHQKHEARPGRLYPMGTVKTHPRIVFRTQRKRHQL